MEVAEAKVAHAPEPAKARRCSLCKGWLLAPQDLYCGFCGNFQAGVALAIPGNGLMLIEKIGKPQHFALHNQRNQPVLVTIVPKGALIPGLSVDPDEYLLLPGGVQSFQLRLDASQLPEGFTTGHQVLSCRLDKDPRKTLDVPVTVKAGPRVLFQPASVDFGQIAQGQQARRELTLANRGGLPLRLSAIEPQGTKQLRLGLGALVPAEIPVGERRVFEVIWDTALGDPEESLRDAGLRFFFGEQIDPFTVPASGRPYRRDLAVEPKLIAEPRVLPAYPIYREVYLTNRGTVDLEIESLHCEAPWVSILEPKGRLTLRAPDPDVSHPKLQVGSGGLEVASVKVKLRLLPGEPGNHETTLQVLGPGNEVLEKLPIRLGVVKTRPYDGFVGIDFGTTNSVVALLDPVAGLRMVKDRSLGVGDTESDFLIPSLIVFETSRDDAVYHIGRRAVNASRQYPDGTVRSIKRLLGTDARDDNLGGSSRQPEDIVAALLGSLKEYAEYELLHLRGEGFTIAEAVFTVPAAFYDPQIQSLLNACRKINLQSTVRKSGEVEAGEQAMILYEPSAAAFAFVHHLQNAAGSQGVHLESKLESKKEVHFLVYDHGGGTLDISVARLLEAEGGSWRLEIKSNLGDSRVGGDTFDFRLMEELLLEFSKHALAEGFDFSLILEPRRKILERAAQEGWSSDDLSLVLGARDQWKILAEETKMGLSKPETERFVVQIRGTEVPLPVEHPQKRFAIRSFSPPVPIQVEGERFEVLVSDLLDRCENLAQRALAVAKLPASEVDYLLHTGRQSLMPAVRDLLTKARRAQTDKPGAMRKPLFRGKSYLQLWEPQLLKICVSQGAARTAEQQASTGEGGIVLPNSGRVLPVSYGIPVRRKGTRLEFQEILSQGTPYPTSAEHFVQPSEINKDGTFRLRIYQSTGESKRLEPKLGTLLLVDKNISNLTQSGEPGCKLLFEVDKDRALTVYADNQPVDIAPLALEDEDNGWW